MIRLALFDSDQELMKVELHIFACASGVAKHCSSDRCFQRRQFVAFKKQGALRCLLHG